MPVWHALSKAWQQQHDLAVVGIAQEQHRERTALYARWQELDWPVLWDPFNLTRASAVPNVYLLDEAGTVLAVRPSPDEVAALLQRPAPAGADEPRPAAAATRPGPLVAQAPLDAEGRTSEAWAAISRLSFGDDPDDGAVAALRAHVSAHPDDAAAHFRLGVALRLRHDGPTPRPGDFQAALDAWGAALAARPGEYIWRRRIQQYGPTLDKPYPFYPWVAQAVDALRERGAAVPPLEALLTEAERATPRRRFEGDPGDADADAGPAAWQRDLPEDDGWVTVEAAVAPHTDPDRQLVRVHLVLRPDADRDVHWNDEAGPPEAWLTAPDGWTLDRRRVRLEARPEHSGPRVLEVELQRAAGAPPGELIAELIYTVCEGRDGVCATLRRELAVPVDTP